MSRLGSLLVAGALLVGAAACSSDEGSDAGDRSGAPGEESGGADVEAADASGEDAGSTSSTSPAGPDGTEPADPADTAGTGGDPEAYCLRYRELTEELGEIEGASDQVADGLLELAASAPDELRDDLETMATSIRVLADLPVEQQADEAVASATLDAELGTGAIDRYTAAADALSTYTLQTCGEEEE